MQRWLSGRVWVIAVAAMAVAACGGDAASDSTASSESDAAAAADGGGSDGVSHQQASSDELEKWQTELNAVGCWAGPVDGSLGPQTESAIRAFQAAKGLTVDGLLGPVTEGALGEAVSAGEVVCTGDEDVTSDSESVATLSSSGYGPMDFAIGSCSSSGESDIQLQAEVNNMTLVVDADMADFSEESGAGTLAVDGGTEGDGITLNGTVESVTVGDAGNFTVTGVFGPPNNEGEEFTLTGSCA